MKHLWLILFVIFIGCATTTQNLPKPNRDILNKGIAMAVTYCSGCGKKLTGAFCGNCGRKSSDSPQPVSMKEKAESGKN